MLCRTSVLFSNENLMTRTTVVSLLAISLLALTGISYAAFTSTATANVNATAGNINLVWNNVVVDGTTVPYANCGVGSLGYNSITLTVSAIEAGDGGCLYDMQLLNSGNVPANSITPSPASGTYFGAYNCFTISYSSVPAALGPGGNAWLYLRVSIDASQPTGCQSQTGSIAVTFTGSS
jgi:predicted ribosomally synthesized peptide with SipW-like signal peptide